jgi:signal transduction histidine kinase
MKGADVTFNTTNHTGQQWSWVTLPEAELVARSTLDSLSAHIAIIDESGAIVATNKAWRDFAESNRAAGQNYAEGANYLQVCDSATGPGSEEATLFAEGIRSVLGHRYEKFELEYPCHSPSEQRWFIGRVTRFPAGGPPRAVVAHENITERKQTEKERAQLLVREQAARAEAEAVQARLATILNNLTEGVLMADPQGYILFANPAARAMLGTTSTELPEEVPDPWGDFHLPEAVAHCAKNGESIEARVRYGETFLRVKLECLAEVGNNLGDVLVVMQDLSEGRRLEANQQRFLANAAHQLKTPIMAILGAAELLATGDDVDPTVRRPLLNHILSEGRRMQRLSETLLRLSRIGWDRREPNLQIVDLSEAGRQAAERMAPLVENMGLRVLVEGEDACAYADPEWLQEVLLVLLSNAIKHSNRGEDIRLRARGSTMIVEDEGVGIRPDDLPHIFERFYRGKDSSEGFGLGLSICRELTERMGGSISISSREGVGTTVKIELPEEVDIVDA